MAAHFAAVQAIAEAGGPLPDWPLQLAQQWAIHLAWLSTRLNECWPPRLGEMLLEANLLLLQDLVRLSKQVHWCRAANSACWLVL